MSTPGTPGPGYDPYDPDDSRVPPAEPGSRAPGVLALAAAAVVVAVAAVLVTGLVLGGGDEPVRDTATGTTPRATPSATSSATPSPTPISAPASEPTGSASATPTPIGGSTPTGVGQPAASTGAGSRGIDASDPLSPWQVSVGDTEGRATWSVPVFRAALAANPSGAAPSNGGGRDLRLFVDPQRVRSTGAPARLLTRALREAVAPPATREAYNGLPYGAPYENLFADDVAFGSATLSDDGSTVRVDLVSGPSGRLLAATDDEVGAQVTAYEQLAWTAAAVLGDDQVGVVVRLDGDPQGLPGTDAGDVTSTDPAFLAPVQLLAPAEGSDESGSVRVIGLVAASAEESLTYLAGSGEDTFESAQIVPGAEEPLGTGLRLVDTRLSLERSLIPAQVDVGLRADEVTDARMVRAVAR